MKLVSFSLVNLAVAFVQCAYTNTTSSSEDEAFLQWFKARGTAPAATLAAFPGMGRGLLAVNAIAEGDVLLSAPAGLVISQRNLARRWPGTSPQDRSIYGAVPGDAAVALFLMRERFLGAASEWSPYLACLPLDVPHTASFSDAELALLEDPRLQASAAQRRHATARMHASLLPALQRLLGGAVAASGESLAEAISLERFRWAMSIVDSRALTLRGEKMLVPFADMVNHRPHPEGRPTQGGEFFVKSHPVAPDGGMTVLADQSFAPGEQIFEDYGDNPDQIYLDYHGFVPAEPNAHDCTWLDISLSSADAAAAGTAAAAAAGGTAGTTISHCVPASGEIDAATTRAAEAAIAARLLALGSSRKDAVAAVRKDVAAAAAAATAAAACRRLARYRSGAAADAALLARLAEGSEKELEDGKLAEIGERELEDGRLAEIGGKELEEGRFVEMSEKELEEGRFMEIGGKELEEGRFVESRKEGSCISGDGNTCGGDGSHTCETEGENAANAAAAAAAAAGLSTRGAMAIAYRLRKKLLLQRIIAAAAAASSRAAAAEATPALEAAFGGNLREVCVSFLGTSTSTATSTSTSGSTEVTEETAEEEELAPLVEAFNEWMEGLGCPAKKLRAALIPGMRVGAVATGKIEREELYLSVPEWAIMDSAVAANDPEVGPAVANMARALGPHGWDPDFDPLLLLLVHEAFQRREKGRFWPYVALLPSPDEVESPLFFSEEVLSRLAGSDLAAAAARYRAAAAAAYDRKWRCFGGKVAGNETAAAVAGTAADAAAAGAGTAVTMAAGETAGSAAAASAAVAAAAAAGAAGTPGDAAAALAGGGSSETEDTDASSGGRQDTVPASAAEPNGGISILPVKMTPERHLWGTAMLDSRSIWWHGRRHLVPLLDLVNCAAAPQMSGKSGGRIHSTRAARSWNAGVVAETNAAWEFEAGEQVLEDYGQPNHVYFLYHGFMLPDNPHDCLYVSSLSIAASAAAAASITSLEKPYGYSFGPPDKRRNFCVSPNLKRLDPGFVAYVRAAAGLPPPAAAGKPQQEGQVVMPKSPAAAAQGLLNDAGKSAVADWARRRLAGYPELPPAESTAALRIGAFVESEKAVLRGLLASLSDDILGTLGSSSGGSGSSSSGGGGTGSSSGGTGSSNSGGGSSSGGGGGSGSTG